MVCPVGLEVYPSGHTSCPTHNVELTPHAADNLVGKTINDRYKVDEALTAGGWASLYKATDLLEKRTVALKVLHSYLLADAETVVRFRREAAAAGALVHPNLAAVFDAGALADGQPYIVMEFIRGITLAERLLTLGQLTAEQAIPLFVKTCDALEFAHQNGIIHRDIKPSNLMLGQTDDGELDVKLVDFGLARAMDKSGLDIDQITRSGQTIGSPAYMSPEQCLGHKLDARSDIYSLGCTMYEAVSGKPPFAGQSILEYMHKHTYEPPQAVEIHSGEANVGYNTAHVIMQALSKNPDERQQSMQQVRDQLKACIWQPPQDKDKQAEKGPRSTFSKLAKRTKEVAAMPKFYKVRGLLSILAPVIVILVVGFLFINVVRNGQHYANQIMPAQAPPPKQEEVVQPVDKTPVAKPKHHH